MLDYRNASERIWMNVKNIVCCLEKSLISFQREISEITEQIFKLYANIWGGFPGGSVVKNPPAKQELQVRSLDREDPLEKGMATHCGILAWRIPWTGEPGGLQSIGLQRVGHNWVTEHTQISEERMNKRREQVKIGQHMETIDKVVRIIVNHTRNQEVWA